MSDFQLNKSLIRYRYLKLNEWFALSGGLILFLLVLMSLVSIIGRKLFSLPIPGDIELVEIFGAVAISSFLPLCELQGNQIKADAFTMKAPKNIRLFLDILAQLLCFLVVSILTWRMMIQTNTYFNNHTESVLLGIPMWLPYILILPSMVLFALSAAARAGDLTFELCGKYKKGALS